MTSQEAATARQRLGLSVEDLSAELGLTPDVVKGWEAGLVRVPNRVAEDLRWRRALQDREEALLTSGLPDCEWMVAWEKEETPDDTKAHAAYMERADKHLKVCPVCNAREQFVAARFGEMPKPPLPAWMTALGWVAIRVEKLPEWARPGVWIGLAFGAYSMFRIILFIPAMLRDPKIVITALTGLSASMAIGASLGLAYGAFRKAKSKLVRREA
jgi:transcriptional regulator with XRE-family HTH domain